MKKLLGYAAAAVLAMIALPFLFPIIGLVISGLLVAVGMHFYKDSNSTFSQILSSTLIIAGIISAISNAPALVGLAFIVILYVLWSKYDKKKTTKNSDDPFTNFEKEWANLNK